LQIEIELTQKYTDWTTFSKLQITCASKPRMWMYKARRMILWWKLWTGTQEKCVRPTSLSCWTDHYVWLSCCFQCATGL